MSAPEFQESPSSRPAVTPQQAEFTSSSKSSLQLYREISVGPVSIANCLYYEFAMLFLSGLPGLSGYALRTLLYPALFERCGTRPAFGRGVSIRRPKQITLGKKVLIDDYAVLDIRGDNAKISLGDFVSLGRFSTISAKQAEISLAPGVNIGSYCRIASQSKVEIAESVLVAAYCYIGPGNHQLGDQDTPMIAREMEIKGGVKIGAHSWIGAHSTILDGVTIGESSVVGAHSLVKDNVPARCVVAGSPARVIKELS